MKARSSLSEKTLGNAALVQVLGDINEEWATSPDKTAQWALAEFRKHVSEEEAWVCLNAAIGSFVCVPEIVTIA